MNTPEQIAVAETPPVNAQAPAAEAPSPTENAELSSAEQPAEQEHAPAPEQGADEADALPAEFAADDLAYLSKNEQEQLAQAKEAAEAAAEPAPEENDAEPAAEAKATPDPEPAPAPAAEAEPAPAPEPFKVPDTTAAKAALEKAKEDRAALHEAYDNGEIELDDWKTQNAALDDQIVTHATEIKMAEKAINDHQAQSDNAWYEQVDAYMAQHPELQQDVHLRGFDAELRAVTSGFPNLPEAAQIQLAHTRYKVTAEATGNPLTSTPGVKEPAPAPVATEQPAPTPAPKRPDAPQTLANAPAADAVSQADGKFATVQRIIDEGAATGDVYSAEDAMGAMSDAEIDRMLATTE